MNAQINKIDLTDSDVTYREVTGGINGYPVPLEGHAVFTNSLDQLKELAESTGTEIHEFWWKNGWQNCEDNWRVDIDEYRRLNIEELDRRTCDGTVISLSDWDKEQWLENERACFDDKEWEDFRAHYEELADELAAAKECGADAAMYGNGTDEFYGLDMGMSYDTKNSRLGIFLPADEWEVEYSHATKIEEEDDDE